MSENVVLSCPNCATRFGAPASRFMPDGRQVRCSQCRHMWFHAVTATGEAVVPRPAVKVAPQRSVVAEAMEPRAQDVEGEAVAPAKTAPVADAVAREKPAPVARTEPDHPVEPAESAKTRGGWAGPLLWLIALLLLLAILAYVFRDPLRAAVPRAAPWLDRYTGTIDRTAQGLVGLGSSHPPLEFRNIHYDVHEYDGEKEILVETELFNTGSSEMPAPKVRVLVVDGERAPLHASVIEPEDLSETIPAGGSTRYFARISEPPAEFEAVLLNIADQE